MRRFSGLILLYWLFTILVVLSLLQGCARPVLQTEAVSEQEFQITASVFAEYLKTYRNKCACCLDAEVDVAVSFSAGLLGSRSVKVSGYLQAMEPGYVKFVATNPLGQPVIIFLTDGEFFKFLNVIEGKAYTGSIEAESFKKYAPEGFNPAFSYYWLTGRLMPGEPEILKIWRDKEEDGYWLHLQNELSTGGSIILFDPLKFLVERHIIINENGGKELEAIYSDFHPEFIGEKNTGKNSQEMIGGSYKLEAICRVPTKISVYSNSGADKKIEFDLFSLLPHAKFSIDDFELEIPGSIKKLIVK